MRSCCIAGVTCSARTATTCCVGFARRRRTAWRIASASPSTTATRSTRSCRAVGRTSCSCRSAWWTSGSSPADTWSVWRSLGVEVHARSAFLQGLLLAPERRPGWAADCPHLRRFDDKCAASGLTPLQICLGFLLARPEVKKIVVGATSVGELDAIVEAANDPATGRSWPSFALTNTPLLDPRRWPNQFPDNRKPEPTPT